MKGTAGRVNWHRSALALVAVYVLVLQTTLAALAAGLSAQPSPTLLHPLCAPGQTAPAEPASDSGSKLPDCCASLCLSAAIALPPPAAPFATTRRELASHIVTVRGKPRQRVFWRDLHAVTGLTAGGFILFLAITGMPWSVLWGAKVNQWANGHNFGYPAGLRIAVPMSDEHLAHAGPTSWSLEHARMPESTAAEGKPIGLDAAIAIFDRLGLKRGYAVNLPSGPSGVYTGSVYPKDMTFQRVIHLD